MTEERERRFIAEYMATAYPQGNWALNVPLGPLPPAAIAEMGINDAAAFFRPSRRRIDAVAWMPGGYMLIEAKIRDALEGLGRLQTYRDLALKTPDLPGYAGQPMKMILVVPWALDWVTTAAGDAGIKVELFKPSWIDAYVAERQKYYTAEWRKARAEMYRARRILGVDQILPPAGGS